MILPRPVRYATLLITACTLAACGGGKGSSEPPPTGVVVSPGDQAVTVSWNALPGVEYWVFIGPPGTTPVNFSSITGAYVASNVATPYPFYAVTLSGLPEALINGKSYAVTINARTNGGPGGASTAPQTVTPRATSTSWQTAAPMISSVDGAADDIYGVAFGLPLYAANNALHYTGNAADFVFVGHNGSAWYTSQDASGQTYTTHAVGTGIATGSDLKGVAYAASVGFMAAGTNGAATFSYDGISWTPQSTGTSRNFQSITSTASTGYIAVGDGCMVYAVGGAGTGQLSNWVDYTAGFTSSAAFSTPCTGATPPSLLTAGAEGGYFMTGGTQGTLAFSTSYYSTSANWWAAVPTYPTGISASSVTIKSLLYGTVFESNSDNTVYTATTLWLAVGGYVDSSNVQRPLILYTTDPPILSGSTYSWTSWQVATLPSGLTGNLNTVSAASDPITGGLTQLVAAGDNGMILYDQLETPTTTSSGAIVPLITDTPAQNWTQATNASTAAINTIGHGNFVLQAAGAAGTRVFTY